MVLQDISKRKMKKIYVQFPLEQKKYDLPDNWFNSQGGIGILKVDTQLNCINRKWIVIKSHQCSLERSYAVLIEVNSEF